MFCQVELPAEPAPAVSPERLWNLLTECAELIARKRYLADQPDNRPEDDIELAALMRAIKDLAGEIERLRPNPTVMRVLSGIVCATDPGEDRGELARCAEQDLRFPVTVLVREDWASSKPALPETSPPSLLLLPGGLT